MSETIRDQAIKAALSILDSQKKIAFASCTNLYQGGVSTPQSSKSVETFIVKVTAEQALKIHKLQQKLLSKQAEQNPTSYLIGQGQNSSEVKITIEDLLSQSTPTLLGDNTARNGKLSSKICGCVESPSGNPVHVEIVSLFGYNQLAGLETPVGKLKYLTAVIDPEESQTSEKLENTLVNAITHKLQAQFTTQYAQNLLGESGYTEMLNLLDKG